MYVDRKTAEWLVCKKCSPQPLTLSSRLSQPVKTGLEATTLEQHEWAYLPMAGGGREGRVRQALPWQRLETKLRFGGRPECPKYMQNCVR